MKSTEARDAHANGDEAAPDLERTLAEMTRQIVELADPERIILFGSHATGRAGPDSDIDLLIVEREPFDETRSRRKEIGRLSLALRHHAIPPDLLVYSQDEWDHWLTSPSHIIAESDRQGRVLYQRP